MPRRAQEETAMPHASASRTLKVSADRAWDLMADWGDTSWIPGPEKTELVESAAGKTRRLHLPGMDPIEETLVQEDASKRELHYTIAPSPLVPFEDYRGRAVVDPLPGGICRVTWDCSFSGSELPEDEAATRATANLHNLLAMLASHLERWRVAQWATGKVGSGALRAVVGHPQMELVGLRVHSEEKAGRDAGELCGIDPVGIAATRSVQDIIASRPDCVLYMQEGYDADDLCALLAAGINVITTRGEFFNPKKMDTALRERIEAACREGGASLHATGSSPGFITEALPLVLTSIARRLDCLTIDEFADIPSSVSTEMMLQVMGYGRPLEDELDPGLLTHMAQCFEDSLSTLADALGIALDGFEVYGETAAGKARIELADGAAIEQGTVAAIRITVAALRDGQPVLRFRTNWYCTTDLDADWQIRDNGWRVQVESDAPLDISIDMPLTGEPVDRQMSGYTAFRAVNAVPFVCAAAPGIVTVMDLPQITAIL
jgi:hypothetical protein